MGLIYWLKSNGRDVYYVYILGSYSYVGVEFFTEACAKDRSAGFPVSEGRSLRLWLVRSELQLT